MISRTVFGSLTPTGVMSVKGIAILFAVVLSSCATGDFTPYSGQQQNWPTQPGAFVSTKYAIPAYIQSWPDRPYIVLGSLDVTTAPIRKWSGGPVAFAAQRAQELGADAIIVREQGQEYVGNFGHVDPYGNVYSYPAFRGRAQVLAIKWK